MRLARTALLLVLVALAAPAAAHAAAAPATCDLVVSAAGDDGAAGTPDAPLATLERLVRALGPGQTGCVRGTVTGDAWITSDRATLTAEPGSRATIRGEVVIDAAASQVTVSDLVIDGSAARWPTPTIYGDHATFARNDVSNGRKDICFQVGPGGSHQRGPVRGTLLVDNRIHDCGTSNNHRHGIYVAGAIATRIVGNTIFDNGDRGIQLYPDAQGTEVAGNVIDGNGEGLTISGAGNRASSGTRVHHNVFSNPRVRASIESSWEDAVGTDNRVEQNCVFGGRGLIDEDAGGFTARFNWVEDPRYANRAAKDFRMPAGSRCGELVAAARRAAGLDAAPATPPRARPPVRVRGARCAGSSRSASSAGRRRTRPCAGTRTPTAARARTS